ncbi:CYFA0S16e02234g1_1 [Cyberlindnera fabianii]|uniref:CYFA0S16e02234g1_1 n=1 Tax=Cyberlindnera fabianii TaxID=36022 RepID=A0A061B598_CYBFA|nr:CYFA0S16e02234g1_1 [Cyberlindnera fabianii]
MSFKRLIRFIAADGKTYFGDAIISSTVTDPRLVTEAYKISGDVFSKHEVTSEVLQIKELLSPLDSSVIRTVRMIGMNYKRHCKEINLPIPEWPCLFYKPSSAINGPSADIVVPKAAQIEETKVDYESELVVVIGKPAKNVSEEDALDYVLGYSVGNDVSQRTWQMDRGGSQFSVGKMFDTWAPFGPAIISTDVIKDPNTLNIGSLINGEQRQQSNTDDAIFSVRRLISHLSMGTTLQPGDLIYTGTPEGVGTGFKPSIWLRDGDVVECYIEGIGSIKNTVKFE